MKRARSGAAGFGCLVFFAVVLNASCSTRPPAPNGFTLETPRATGRFVVYGDTRRAVVGEPLLRETHFDRERQLVADRLVAERPDFIIHSGDLVGRGSSGTQWDEEWDVMTAPLKRAGVPIFMSFGNHEYWLDPGEAMQHIHSRFPRLERRHWYALRYDRLLFVMLDSNFDKLYPDEVRRQDDWLERTLDDAGADATIATVIAVFHHPLYTNSVVHKPDAKSREHFLPRFAACAKLRIVFNGHVHNYERFLIGGVHYVVAGGGGAPKTAVDIKAPQYRDEFAGPAVRPFQYCLLTLEAARLAVDIMMLGDDGTWYRGDGFVVE
jgi:predicted phosphodiesterase